MSGICGFVIAFYFKDFSVMLNSKFFEDNNKIFYFAVGILFFCVPIMPLWQDRCS